MNTERLRRYAYITILTSGALALAFLFFRYVFSATVPFLIAWGVAFAVRRPANFLEKKLKLPRTLSRILVTVALVIVIFGTISASVWLLSRELWRFFSELGTGEEFAAFLSEFVGSLGAFGEIFGSLGETVSEAVYELVMSLVRSLGNFLTAFVGKLPGAVISVVITVIASLYFALDLERINAFFTKYIPKKVSSVLIKLKSGFFGIGIKYLRAYLLLMLITFINVLAGLYFLGVSYPILPAFIISLLDMLPIIGVGTVLIPWSIISFVSGKAQLGIGLLILYVVNEIIRNIAEPKIVGKHLGVHPLLTLVLLYAGYTLFGFIGLLLVPAFAVVISLLFENDSSAEVNEGGAT